MVKTNKQGNNICRCRGYYFNYKIFHEHLSISLQYILILKI